MIEAITGWSACHAVHFRSDANGAQSERVTPFGEMSSHAHAMTVHTVGCAHLAGRRKSTSVP